MPFWKPVTDGLLLEIRARPGSGTFCIEAGERLTVFLKRPPEGGKANRELVRELGRLFRKEVRLLAGAAARNKTVLVVGAREADLAALER